MAFGLTGKKIISYAVMPGIKPRLQQVFASGFQTIPVLIALVFVSVRLIPGNHAYLRPENIGKFGIRHVIGEAANNLIIDKKHIDQIIVFILILSGMALLALQIAMIAFTLFSGAASAQNVEMPKNFSELFLTPEPKQDIAHIMMDMVFGTKDIFKSCITTHDCVNLNNELLQEVDQAQNANGALLNSLGYPFPIHIAMHKLFEFYSIGLLVVAAIISGYFIATVLLETAQTGTPFGKRFNKVWAPLRIVMAFGLLIPIGDYGLNSSQYIVLYAAKFGSGFATNGWIKFNDILTANSLDTTSLGNGTQAELVSKPNTPDISGLLQFLYTARTCKAYDDMRRGADPATNPNNTQTSRIKMYLVRDPLSSPNFLEVVQNTPYSGSANSVLAFAGGKQYVTIRFGHHDEKQYVTEKGNVLPVCGELILTLNDPRSPDSADNKPEPAALEMQTRYWTLIRMLAINGLQTGGTIPGVPAIDPFLGFPQNTARKFGQEYQDGDAVLPDDEFKTKLNNYIANSFLKPGVEKAITDQINSGHYNFTDELKAKGWAGAGIWYNKIAEINGLVSTVVNAVPTVSKYPLSMENMRRAKSQQVQNMTPMEQFNPRFADGGDVTAISKNTWSKDEVQVLWEAYRYWTDSGGLASTDTAETGNPVMDIINGFFGTEGLYNIRENKGIHPLAQVVGIGRSLVESAIRNLGFSIGASLGAGTLNWMSNIVGGTASTVISITMTFVLMALTIGFVLFYVVPFMPFLYFFFAVGGWVKAVFEAMVGAPLWAVSHIRIDGDGLPGRAAWNGYMLIFEIFLRPILIIFGMLAGMITFSALVGVLNDIWDIVISNVSGYNAADKDPSANNSFIDMAKGPIDEFFYTVLYTIIVYLMATSSFKLIDSIPRSILRWMGESAPVFQDGREDGVQGLMGKAGLGGQQIIKTVGGNVSQLLEQASTGFKSGK